MPQPVDFIQFARGHVALVREPQVEQALPLREAIAELGALLRGTPQEHLINQPRVRIVSQRTGDAWLHTLRGGLPLVGIAGGKDYTSRGFDTLALWVTAVSLHSGLPIALVEADYLTRLRTAAVAAVATDILAPPEPRTLAHFGVGKISELLVRAMLEVRPSLERVLLVRRQADVPLPDWVRRLAPRAEIRRATAQEAMDLAEVATTATSSKTPVIPAGVVVNRLRHLNLIGSNHRLRREIDQDLLQSVLPPRGFLVVDDPLQAAEEAGELIAAGPLIDWENLPSLPRLAREPTLREQARSAQRTAFKSVGVGVMDLAVASAVLQRLGLLPQPP